MELTAQFGWQAGRSRAAGRAPGPDVVFSHGAPFSSYVGNRYVDVLATAFTAHLWDMPG